MSESKQRIKWLDIAKGTGILLVVLGHCLDIEKCPFQIIFIFHMPLFFVLSGYVFKYNENFMLFLKKKFKSLIVPFIVFYILGLVVTLIVPVWRTELTWQGIGRDLWLADPNAVHNSSIWFLVCLFWVQILYWMIDKCKQWKKILILVILATAGILYSRQRYSFLGYTRLPFDLDVVPIACVFFAIGVYLKRKKLLDKICALNKYKIVILFGISLTGIAIVYHYNGYVNLHGLSFGNPVLYFIGGILGSFSVICISVLIQMETKKVALIEKVMLFYGKNSLIVLGIQSLLIRLYIIMMGVFGIELGLYHFPIQHTLICFFLVAGICCPIVCGVWTKCKKP